MNSNPVQIAVSPFTGPLAPTFEDPIGVLKACHGCIEQRLQMLERACEISQGNDLKKRQEATEALKPVVGYFTTGGVKHTEDEEISLFPRMRAYLKSGDEALAVMHALESQHREAESFVNELKEVVARLTRQPWSFDLKDTEWLESITVKMGTHYRPHIKLEDESVFPKAADILSEEELAVIGKEMARRRNVLLRK